MGHHRVHWVAYRARNLPFLREPGGWQEHQQRGDGQQYLEDRTSHEMSPSWMVSVAVGLANETGCVIKGS
jgi:hypothetical protein